MRARHDCCESQLANAKVYIGTTLCGTLPGTPEKRKVYPITCDVVGDYVKLVSGSTLLGFAEVEVYTKFDDS